MSSSEPRDAIERIEPALISSPAATGGAGTSYEQHVGAYFLNLLLTRGVPPVLGDSTVSEVAFQTKHLGWDTDDLLVVGERSHGISRKMLIQVKRSFVISAKDDDCVATINGFWHDFGQTGEFSHDHDELAIATLRGTNRLLGDFGSLLETARATTTPEQFQNHIDKPGLLAKGSKRDLKSLQSILKSSGDDLSIEELHSFLRCIHILPLDFQATPGITESQIKSLLAYTTKANDSPVETAIATWDSLLGQAADAATHAKQLQYDSLPLTLREKHDQVRTAIQSFLESLESHTRPILGKIKSVAGGISVDRSGLVSRAAIAVSNHQVTILSGPGGSGKSALAKSLLEHFKDRDFVFAFNASEFGFPHLNNTLSSAGFPGNIDALERALQAQTSKLVLIDGVDRLLEAQERDALQHLLQLAGRDPSWRVLMTCRDYSTDLVRSSMLGEFQGATQTVELPLLSDEELDYVSSQHKDIQTLLGQKTSRRLLANPYFLDCACQMEWGSESGNPVASERQFRKKLWNEVVHNGTDGQVADAAQRHEAFEEVALRRAKAMSPFVPSSGLTTETITSLRKDGLLAYSDESGKLVAPRHDVLEDWALLSLIDYTFEASEGLLESVSAVVGTYPTLRRAYRKWLQEIASHDPDTASKLFAEAIDGERLADHCRDDTIVAFLQSNTADSMLASQESVDLNDPELLTKLVNLLRVGCTSAPAWYVGGSSGTSVVRTPAGPAWPAVLNLVAAHLASFSEKHVQLLLGLINDFSRVVSCYMPYPKGAKSAVAIAECDDLEVMRPKKPHL